MYGIAEVGCIAYETKDNNDKLIRWYDSRRRYYIRNLDQEL